jgi:hypothetical protein
MAAPKPYDTQQGLFKPCIEVDAELEVFPIQPESTSETVADCILVWTKRHIFNNE